MNSLKKFYYLLLFRKSIELICTSARKRLYHRPRKPGTQLNNKGNSRDEGALENGMNRDHLIFTHPVSSPGSKKEDTSSLSTRDLLSCRTFCRLEEKDFTDNYAKMNCYVEEYKDTKYNKILQD